ncbi:MAG: succinylglutamate desuccinylase/aspartoacylase family protein [Dehalococcoidia bacterium]
MTVTAVRFGRDPRPEVAIISGIHGDEFNGAVALHAVIERLLQIEGSIRKSVLLIPCVNPLATDTVRRNFPFEGMDLHSAFDREPGQPRSLEEHLVDPLKEAVQEAQFLVDIHSSNSLVLEVPQVRYYRSSTEPKNLQLRRAASSFGLPVVWEKADDSRSIDREAPTPIAQSLVNSHSGMALFLQAGMAGTINAGFAAEIADGLLRFLGYAGVVDQSEIPGSQQSIIVDSEDSLLRITLDRNLEGGKQVPSEPRGGLFVPTAALRVGEVLGKGNHNLGALINPADGSRLGNVVVKLQSPAIIMAARVGGLTYPGGLIARLVLAN